MRPRERAGLKLVAYAPTEAVMPTVVTVAGELDAWAIAELADAIAHAIVNQRADVVVDLSGVEFLTSGATRVLIRTHTFMQHRSRALSLRAPSPNAQRVLQRVGLAELIEPGTVGYGAQWPGTDD